MRIRVITPYGEFLDEEADFVKLPGKSGEIGVLPNHSPLVSTLKIGELLVQSNGEKAYYFIPDGVVKVDQEAISVLVPYIESSNEIDVKRAESSLERAVKRLTSAESDVDLSRARNSKLRAQCRIDILNTINA